MDKSKPLSQLTLEELQKRKATFRGILIGGAITWFILASIMVYLTLKSGNYVLLAIFPALLVPLILPSFIFIAQINKEIKARENP